MESDLSEGMIDRLRRLYPNAVFSWEDAQPLEPPAMKKLRGEELMRQAALASVFVPTMECSPYKELLAHSHDGKVVGTYDVSPHVYFQVSSWLRMRCPICSRVWLTASTGDDGGYAEEVTGIVDPPFDEIQERLNKFVKCRTRLRVMKVGSTPTNSETLWYRVSDIEAVLLAQEPREYDCDNPVVHNKKVCELCKGSGLGEPPGGMGTCSGCNGNGLKDGG